MNISIKSLLICFICFISFQSYAQSKLSGSSSSANPVNKEMLQFIKGRNDYLFKQAKIIDSEKIILVKALNDFDANRQKVWLKAFQDRELLKRNDVKEEDYKEALKNQVEYMRSQADILQKLISDLENQLSYKKIYSIIILEKQYAKSSLSSNKD